MARGEPREKERLQPGEKERERRERDCGHPDAGHGHTCDHVVRVVCVVCVVCACVCARARVCVCVVCVCALCVCVGGGMVAK